MSGINLDDYVDVAERIAKFHEKYPEGSLRCAEWSLIEVNGESFIVYQAKAYRTPDDQAPAEGTAWEPVPGKTPFTRDSELQNAETSAWGRAIAALGFEVRNGIASRQDVQNRSNNGGDSERPASEKQRKWVLGDGEKPGLVQNAGFDDDQLALIADWSQADGRLTSSAASFLIENLKDGTAEGRSRVLEMVGWSDVPLDTPPDQTDFEGDGKTAPADENDPTGTGVPF